MLSKELGAYLTILSIWLHYCWYYNYFSAEFCICIALFVIVAILVNLVFLMEFQFQSIHDQINSIQDQINSIQEQIKSIQDIECNVR